MFVTAFSQRGSPPPSSSQPDENSNVVVTSLQTVSEHCYSNNPVVNPSAERKRELEIRNHNRVHKETKDLMPPPPPPTQYPGQF